MKVVPVFLRTPHNYDRDQASRESGLKCLDDTLAKQSFKEECDINTIIKRFGLSGQLPQNVRPPMYGDFTSVTDFRSALHAIEEARDSFNAMPADVRSRFENDPAQFVDFCSDPANLPEMRRLGLAVPETPVAAPPATPTAPSQGGGVGGAPAAPAPAGAPAPAAG